MTNKDNVEIVMQFPYDLMRRLGELPNAPGEALGDKIVRILEDGIRTHELWIDE